MIDWKTLNQNRTVRNERRVMVEVDVEPAYGQSAFEQHLPAGKSTILIYESELAELDRLTQTEDEKQNWTFAVRQYEAELERTVGRISDPTARQHAISIFGKSPSSFFETVQPGGKRPFKSHRILQREIDPPETIANVQANQFDKLASVLAALLGNQQTQPQSKQR
jgi:hypothetical protein